MTRSIVSLAVLVTIAGCQSLHRNPTNPPARVDARLAAIEQARLASDPGTDAIACRSRSVEPATRAPGLGRGVHTNREDGYPPSKLGGSWGDASSELGASWALSDLGNQDIADETPTGLDFSADDTERRATYVRKPPLPSFWDTAKRDVRDMPGDLWRDTKRVYASPTNLAILGTALGGSFALRASGPDDTVEDHFRSRHHHFKKDWRDGFGAAGNPGTHFALAGLWYLVGQQSGDEKTYEVGKTMFSALIINGLTTLVGQAATWDRPPNGERGGSLPSGHTSSSFAMASVLHEAYGHAVGIPLYGLATLVAIERVEDGEHYFSDVIMGAVLGTVVGHSVATGRDPEFFGWKVLPYAGPGGGAGIAFAKTLP